MWVFLVGILMKGASEKVAVVDISYTRIDQELAEAFPYHK